MQSRNLFVGAALIVSTSLFATAQATTVESQTFKELVQMSEAGVIASVANVEFQTVSGQTYTLTTFDVSDTAFGSTGSAVTVRTMGGQISTATIPVAETVAGSPRFLNGSSYLLLLDQGASAAEFSLSGTFRGALPVVNDQVRLPQSSTTMSVSDAMGVVRDLRTAATGEVGR